MKSRELFGVAKEQYADLMKKVPSGQYYRCMWLPSPLFFPFLPSPPLISYLFFPFLVSLLSNYNIPIPKNFWETNPYNQSTTESSDLFMGNKLFSNIISPHFSSYIWPLFFCLYCVRFCDHWRFVNQRFAFLGAFIIYLESERLITREELATMLAGLSFSVHACVCVRVCVCV